MTVSSALAAAVLLSSATANAGLLIANGEVAQDVGPSPATDTVSASIILKVRNPLLLETFVALSQEPLLPTYHRFLSTGQFADLFAPSKADIATITRFLAANGITVTEVFADRLVMHATGTVAAFSQAFSTEMHQFTTRSGKSFRHPVRNAQLPVLMRDLLVVVGGFSTLTGNYHPMVHRSTEISSLIGAPAQQPVLPPNGTTATGIPGDFTVGDFANNYNINPLYNAAINGTGRTVGIVTLATFNPQDAFTYWNLIGLNVDPGRFTQVHVDGGGDLNGAVETALDVEQSGGVAFGAKVIEYDAPNSDQGFIDLFYKAASDNLLDTLSCSWGQPEIDFEPGLNGGVDFRTELVAFHQAFLELAAQGTSTFIAAGDAGAFDINRSGFELAFGQPASNTLTVDHPAADPAVTAAGGTTLPVSLLFQGATTALVVPTEQVWGWDYIQNFFVAQFGPQFQNFVFPVGGGGGVSVEFGVPLYQLGTKGVRKSQPGQSFAFDAGDGNGLQDLFDLPANFPGRNVPDISANADPETGYLVQSTPDGGLLAGIGGTSVIAPQLNGVTALLAQAAGTRLGLMNPMLYRFARLKGASAPITDITAGDNWFFNGAAGFEPSAGLGVPNVANLAAAIKREAHPF
jgi:subtilase family serine protease